MEIALLILLGLPGSGKTSFAKFLIRNVKNFEDVIVFHICYDLLISHFQNEEKISWAEARKKVLKIVEYMIVLLKEFPANYTEMQNCMDNFRITSSRDENVQRTLSHRAIIVIDDNMYHRSMRYEFFKVAKKFSIGFCQVYIHCNIGLAQERNSLRSEERVPDEVILNMCEKLSPPNSKNSWEKYFCSISSERSFTAEDTLSVFNVVEKCIKDPVVPAHSERNEIQVSRPNVIHEADIALRRIVGAEIKQLSTVVTSNKKIIESLHFKKQSLMQKLKDGDLRIPESICTMIINNEQGFQKELQSWWLTCFCNDLN